LILNKIGTTLHFEEAYLSILVNTPTYTEQELIKGLVAHDEQTYGYLYDNYSKALFTVISQIIPSKEMAEEVLQEVFVKIWQHINSYDPMRGRLYTWMINIARNQAIDRTRSREFSQKSMTTALPESISETRGSGPGIQDVGLMRTLNSLPEESRKLLELAYFQGYTHEEIAAITNTPLGTVKTRIRNTIIHLRKILDNK
jgi:RNA polymerase sigma factor (sigma-70 family)